MMNPANDKSTAMDEAESAEVAGGSIAEDSIETPRPLSEEDLWGRLGDWASALATEDLKMQIDKEIRKHVDEANEFALSSPEPPLEDLYTNIYYKEPTFKVRGGDAFTYGDSAPRTSTGLRSRAK